VALSSRNVTDAVWNVNVQQYNANGTKLSVKKAAFILGNISQCFTRVLDGQKTILTELAALRREVAAVNANMGTSMQKALAENVVTVKVEVEGK
jgi:hypothetical protein